MRKVAEVEEMAGMTEMVDMTEVEVMETLEVLRAEVTRDPEEDIREDMKCLKGVNCQFLYVWS